MTRDTIRNWDDDGALSEDLTIERHLGRYTIGAIAGASIMLLMVTLLSWLFHRSILAAGASHVVTSGLETVVSPEDLAIIDEEFDRAESWYTDGRLELRGLVRAMQVVMASDIVAHVATRTMRESMLAWSGVDPAQADLIAQRVGGGIVARRISPKQLGDALGIAGRRQGPGQSVDADAAWGRSFLLYGDRIQLARRPREADAQAAITALESLLDAQTPDVPPLQGDLRIHV